MEMEENDQELEEEKEEEENFSDEASGEEEEDEASEEEEPAEVSFSQIDFLENLMKSLDKADNTEEFEIF